jgi:hypothetical protein
MNQLNPTNTGQQNNTGNSANNGNVEYQGGVPLLGKSNENIANNGLPPLPNGNNERNVRDLERERKKKAKKKRKEEYDEPVKEKVVYVERDRRRRGGLGCRSIILILVLLTLAICCGTIYIFVSKPTGVWDSVVNFLNADLVLPEYDNTTYESAATEIEQQVQSVGANEVVITEDQLTALARGNLEQLNEILVDVQEGKLRLIWPVDKTLPENPLYALIDIDLDDLNNPKISKLGTERLGLPQFLNDAISNAALSALNFGNNEEDPNALIKTIVFENEEVQIESIDFEKDEIVIQLNVAVDLF